jgi:hypothetical protein
MPRFLLATRTVLDLASLTPARQWLDHAGARQVLPDDIFISAITPVGLENFFKTQPASPLFHTVQDHCRTFVRRLEQTNQIVPITKAIADLWGRLLEYDLQYTTRDGRLASYTELERFVMATAIEGTDGLPYVLVATRQPAHSALEPLGLRIEDPTELYP